MERKSLAHARGSASVPSRARKQATYCLLIFTIFTGTLHNRVLRGFETQAVADSLYKTGQFANPFRYQTGPTAHLAPVFPLLLTSQMMVWGDGPAYETAKEVLSAFAASLQYALLPVLAVALGWDAITGVLATALSIGMFLLLPTSVLPLETHGSWEHTYAALGIVALTILAANTIRQAKFSNQRAVAWGVGWGLYLLLIPSMALVYPVWLTNVVRRHMRFAALATLCLLLTLTPWTIRNLLVLGSPVWGRSNLGLELYVSNNDCAAAAFAEMSKSGCHARTHPNASPTEARRLKDAGEVRCNQQRMSDAFDWIGNHAGRFASLTVERIRLFWFPDFGLGRAAWPIWLITLLGFAGLARCAVSNKLAAVLLGGLLAVYPLAYYPVQHVPRYRYPILWVSSLLAAQLARKRSHAIKI